MLPTPKKSSIVSIPRGRVNIKWTQPIWVALFKKLASIDVIAPVLVGILVLLAWDILVRVTKIPPYILPGPILVLQTLISDWNTLFYSLIITLQITIAAFVAAVVSGFLVSVLFTQSKWIERSLFPYAVILQTTPIVAIAPLIIIWLKNKETGMRVRLNGRIKDSVQRLCSIFPNGTNCEGSRW